ncbi:hypothetical protein LWC05_16300 [Acetobacter sicerae]|uniref:Uncharacterized protein n=1 Tax=Acetobacter sicerae TaxID=85325 RepID=A0ABS8VWT2_9PROT|nr:hypothetical protein [Acetobacter sicerae]MCE0745435.1 hypothetical protein [Acetobacter sicerae]
MDMPVSTSPFLTENDETSQTGQSLIEVARHHGMRDDDPVMPLIVAWQASLEALRAQQSHLGALYIKAEKEITYALQKRIEFSDNETERLNALAATLQVRMVSDIGNTIARESQNALTKRVKLIEARTVRALAATLLLSEPDPKVFEQYQHVVIHSSLRRDGVNSGMDWYCPTRT